MKLETYHQICGKNKAKVDMLKELSPHLIRIASKYNSNLSEIEVKYLLDNNDEKMITILRELFNTYYDAQTENDLANTSSTSIPWKNIPVEFNYLGNNVTAVENCLSHLTIPYGSKILITPNFVSKEEYPETTDINTLESIVCKLVMKGLKPIIGDGPSLFFDSEKAFQKYYYLSKKYPVKFQNYNKTTYKPIQKTNWSALKIIYVPESLFEVEYVLSLANLKQHNSFTYSGAKKNTMGLISPATRLALHRLPNELRSVAIDELDNYFSPRLTIIDAREVMIGAQQKIYGGVAQKGPGFFIGSSANKIDEKLETWITKKTKNR
jgi:hypothetical protein